MSDLVEDFLAREKDGLAGLENEIPAAIDGEKSENCFLRFISDFLTFGKISRYLLRLLRSKLQRGGWSNRRSKILQRW